MLLCKVDDVRVDLHHRDQVDLCEEDWEIFFLETKSCPSYAGP